VTAPLEPAAERRLRAKRQNERVKLLASFLNTLSLAFVGAALVIPGVASTDDVRWVWLPAALRLHLAAHLTFRYLKSEE